MATHRPTGAIRARSSVDRALASGARGRKFESCRARSERPLLMRGFCVSGDGCVVGAGAAVFAAGARWCPFGALDERSELRLGLRVAAHPVAIDAERER